MEIEELARKTEWEQDKKIAAKLANMEQLFLELEKKQIPDAIVNSINGEIRQINSFSGTNRQLLSQLRKSQNKIVGLLEKELKLVTLNHYRNIWLALGMAAFGLPIGVAVSLALGNIGLLAVGLPFGIMIGIGVGSSLDKKAKDAGNQLDVELKY